MAPQALTAGWSTLPDAVLLDSEDRQRLFEIVVDKTDSQTSTRSHNVRATITLCNTSSAGDEAISIETRLTARFGEAGASKSTRKHTVAAGWSAPLGSSAGSPEIVVMTVDGLYAVTDVW